ncbi:MAG: hypothetical protein IPG88_12720 [Gemmatimonadetes bacterium]|nr:hypothetical protein [Gemmatimonadota bacterium]
MVLLSSFPISDWAMLKPISRTIPCVWIANALRVSAPTARKIAEITRIAGTTSVRNGMT